MKKIAISLIIFSFLLFLSGCQSNEIIYTDNNPFSIEMESDSLKILQITDLHLMFGIDNRDQKTFDLIKRLSSNDEYDLIVISGDMTMSPQGPLLFKKLINFMESLEIPWTFVFGNHETDFHDYEDFLSVIKDTKYLYFKVGPKLTEGGVGNFKITFTKDTIPFYHLYFMDSKAERYDDPENIGDYDYINTYQVSWFEDFVTNDTEDNIVFMHIPLMQFDVTEGYVGIYNEKQVYAQGKDEGFYAAAVSLGKTKGIFVGHDHLNDFYVIIDGIYLAYGRATGFNGYGNLERGARHIEISPTKEMTSYVLLDSEV